MSPVPDGKVRVCVPVIEGTVANLRILQRGHTRLIQSPQSKPFCGGHACWLRFAFCR